MLIRAYHEDRGDSRRKVIIPDSAHGTNPATVSMCGYEAVTVPSGDDGLVDADALEALVDDDVAGLMITNPNTLGLFERQIKTITDLLHAKGALVYLDGANMNAILGITRPGDFGADMQHYNVHKTFTGPHGAGGLEGGRMHLPFSRRVPRSAEEDRHASPRLEDAVRASGFAARLPPPAPAPRRPPGGPGPPPGSDSGRAPVSTAR